MKITKSGLAICAATLLVSTYAFAEPVKTEAVITAVDGNTITAKTMNGPLTVILTPTTKITQTSGIAKKEARPVKALIPGLIFTVNGDMQGQTVTAEDIKFKDRDWRAAVATKAGTAAEFSELRSAIIGGQEYVIREESIVYFPTGSTVIGATYKQNLTALAQKAPTYGNYRKPDIRQLPHFDPRLRRPNRQRCGERASEPEARHGCQQLSAPNRGD